MGSPEKTRSLKKNSYIISACILLSRLFGLLREVVLARYLGTSIYSDALKAALRIPNFLQNLFGEGVLSASFIPVYTKLRSENKNEAASKAAQELGLILLILLIVICPFGIFTAEYFVEFFAPGYTGEIKFVTTKLIQILFPATGLLVLSAWCLGILNSHKLFILSYSSPIVWNFTIIIGLFLFASENIDSNCFLAAYLFLLGSFLQTFVQIPKTFSLVGNVKLKIGRRLSSASTEIIGNFFPVVLGRGVVQLSSYIDTILASFLATGSLSALMYAQTIFLMPVSVFGLSNAAASLTEFSEKDLMKGSDDDRRCIVNDLKATFERIYFYTAPITVLFFLAGKDLIRLFFESGKFDSASTRIVSVVLVSLGIGLIPTTFGRVMTSLLYAAKLQHLASKIAIFRLAVSLIFSYLICFEIFPRLNISESIYVAGIGCASSISAFSEIFILNFYLKKYLSIRPIADCVFKNKNIGVTSIILIIAVVLFFLTMAGIRRENYSFDLLTTLIPLLVFACAYLGLHKFLKKI